jgi:hypothetical protein
MVTGGPFWDPSLYKATASYAWLEMNLSINRFSSLFSLLFSPQLKLAESSSTGLAACPGTIFGKHGMYMDATGVVYVVALITCLLLICLYTLENLVLFLCHCLESKRYSSDNRYYLREADVHRTLSLPPVHDKETVGLHESSYDVETIPQKKEPTLTLKRVHSGLTKIRHGSIKVLKKVGNKIKTQIYESKKRRCVNNLIFGNRIDRIITYFMIKPPLYQPKTEINVP